VLGWRENIAGARGPGREQQGGRGRKGGGGLMKRGTKRLSEGLAS